MRYIFFTFIVAILLSGVALGQTSVTQPLAAIATSIGFSGAGPTYAGALGGWTDVYSVGFSGNDVQIGDLFIDATAKIYEITSVSSQSFASATVILTSLETPHTLPAGKGVIWRPLDGGLIPTMPSGGGFIGSYLQNAIINHNAAIQAEGTPGAGGVEGRAPVYRDTTLTATGISVSASITGTAPTITGTAGNYTITVPEGGGWQWFKITAASAPAATSGNDLTVVITNDNTTADWSEISLFDTATDQLIDAPQEQYGIVTTQTQNSGTTVTTTLTGVGGLSGFILYLTR
jgi:hypothetical protein